MLRSTTSMPRQKFTERKFLLSSPDVRERAIALINNLPIDAEKPLELVVREEVKKRKLDQNALMFAGPLKDISEQGYVDGRRYSVEVWHIYFKEKYLPDEYDAELCVKETYQKWEFDPAGKRRLVGSTTELTVKGFAQYLEQVYADGADIGVIFHENPNDKIPGWIR